MIDVLLYGGLLALFVLGSLFALFTPHAPQVIVIQAAPPPSPPRDQGSGFGILLLLIGLCVAAALLFPA